MPRRPRVSRTKRTRREQKPTAKQKENTENWNPAFRQFDALPLFAYRSDAVIVWLIWKRRLQQHCKHSNRFFCRLLFSNRTVYRSSSSQRPRTEKKTTVERAVATIISERSQKHRHIKIDEFTTYQCDLKCKIKDWKDSKLFLRCTNTKTAHTQSAAAHRQKLNVPCRVTWAARQKFVFFGFAAACSSAVQLHTTWMQILK